MLIEILCKLMRLISRDPIGVNVELCYGLIGEKNLRKGLIRTNYKAMGLVWMVGRSRGTIW